MPIGGFVVSVLPVDRERVERKLTEFSNVTVYGSDEKGNIIVVMESETSDEMDELVETIKRIDGVLSVGLACLYFEDEVEKIERGELKPEISFGRRRVQ
ncbi:conserved hypothetical protein [Thermosulfidibacter takaii ABI70S6]|uniref:Chaperone NapD n=1 Tax=Thermosulfidibacter takaii (strain DSM 17441 / JCM 13301 / NBRC 103674 / ABI70S6) TaxID=1298851 RepID=A0A0S3QRC2_THET7|nr:chaperone NapD [Thermosulfidibacter takaii]BAT70886.1 conserved hypothetical protein [Thermosulfidibacter takaii ABI70S6]